MVGWVGCEDSAKESGLSHDHLEPLVVISWRICQCSRLGVCEDSCAGVGRENDGEMIARSINVVSAKILATSPSFLFYVPSFVYGVVKDGSAAQVW